ncbi:heterokaryon incompatibility protein-domain-containing protein [Cadophora sp. MPI-SDFR-AT-0126]|nr:heterokaryon incompatibility protein-domain-containing protein [Leotiomycetes sp. MPI-SDFR-AT-0126]
MEAPRSPESSKSATIDCTVCRHYRAYPHAGPGGWDFNLEEVSRAAESGCSTCHIFASSVSSIVAEKPITSFSVHASDAKGFSFAGPDADGSMFYFTAPHVSMPHELYSTGNSYSEFPSAAEARNIMSSGSSKSCFDLAKVWLENCLSNHTICSSNARARLPTRVVDVSYHTTRLRLHVPKNEEAEYIALSHCWGVSPPLQTTTSNLQAMLHGIEFLSLPRNFQDAVTVTRELGIRYLWIDSLCIIQNSNEDWAYESTQMSKIYSNALVVIAAAAGDGCESGFLAGGGRKEAVPMTSLDGSKMDLFLRPVPRLKDPYGSHFRHSDQRSKLSTRGWAFQEQLLARRILSYSEEEMAWECLEESLCECQSPGSPRPKSLEVRRIISSLIAVMNLDSRSFHTMWTEFVQEYTLRELSFPSDRIAALRGIENVMYAFPTSGEYYAGIWGKYILHGLAWRAGPSSKIFQYGGFNGTFTSRRQQRGYAPSWSWASVTGPISFWSQTASHEPRWDLSAEVVACTFDKDETDALGVTDGNVLTALDITGRLLKVSIGEPDMKDSTNYNPPFFKILFPASKMFGFFANPDVFDEDYYNFGEDHYLVSLFHYSKDRRPTHENDIFHFTATSMALVVRKLLVHGERDCYERVACVLLEDDHFALFWECSEERKFILI